MFMPYFVSFVILKVLVYNIFEYQYGLINNIITSMGGERIDFYNTPSYWPVLITLFYLWKNIGYGMVVYLATIMGIDTEYYEAAKVDGANRFQRIWHVTLPCIKPTIIVLLIMSIGSALNVGMERQMLLSNSVVQDHAMVLSWFAYVRGIGNNNYGLGTAIGVFQSVVGVILLFIANKVAGLIGEDKLV